MRLSAQKTTRQTMNAAVTTVIRRVRSYRETSFDFVSRLMEQEGIYYYFRHEKSRHVLVLADAYGAPAAALIMAAGLLVIGVIALVIASIKTRKRDLQAEIQAVAAEQMDQACYTGG